jgi:hypothetical protein
MTLSLNMMCGVEVLDILINRQTAEINEYVADITSRNVHA